MSDQAGRGETEQEHWRADHKLREREVEVKEREQQLRSEEVPLRRVELSKSRWSNPLVLAILAAAFAAAGNASVAWLNARGQTSLEESRSAINIALEESKAESSRILEVIKTGDPEKAAVNLRFLLDAGLINSELLRSALQKFLNKRKPGFGPVLPTGAANPRWWSGEVDDFVCMILPDRTKTDIGEKISSILRDELGFETSIARAGESLQVSGQKRPKVNLESEPGKRLSKEISEMKLPSIAIQVSVKHNVATIRGRLYIDGVFGGSDSDLANAIKWQYPLDVWSRLEKNLVEFYGGECAG